jgi:hypothetical protein
MSLPGDIFPKTASFIMLRINSVVRFTVFYENISGAALIICCLIIMIDSTDITHYFE